MIAIRGATSIQQDDPQHIAQRVEELYQAILDSNSITRIITIFFSVTPDIRSINPATVLRTRYRLDDVAFLCFQEAMFDHSPPKIIRILIMAEGTGQHFVYLHEASHLRDTPTLHLF